MHSYWSIGVFSWEFVRKFRVLILTKATEKKIAIFDWGLATFFPLPELEEKKQKKEEIKRFACLCFRELDEMCHQMRDLIG